MPKKTKNSTNFFTKTYTKVKPYFFTALACVGLVLIISALAVVLIFTPNPNRFNPNNPNVFVRNNFEREVFRLTNIERVNYGLPRLIWCNILATAARTHSFDMQENNFMSHTGSDGSSVSDRVNRIGGIPGQRGVGENIARGHQTPQQVVQAWMNSEGHRANILRATSTHLGVGFVGVEGEHRLSTNWTQKFATVV